MTRPTPCYRSFARFALGVPAIALLVAACVTAGPDALSTLKVPEGAPRVSGMERVAEREQQRLVASLGGRYRWTPMDAMLSRVVARIADVTGRPSNAYDVAILNSPSINAFAIATGKVYVTRGLLALARSEGEVAAVLAHEIAHVSLDHARARAEFAQKSALVTRVVSDVLQDANASRVARTEGRVTLATFSRAQELEADRIGINVIARAGYDPYSSARFLMALDRQAQLRGGRTASADFLSSHPSTPERISAAISVAREVRTKEAGATGAGSGQVEIKEGDYLGAINGMLYGDDPAGGVVRGQVFASPRLAVSFVAPDNFTLESSAEAVIGLARNSAGALRFDHVAGASGGTLEEFIASGWIEGLEVRNVRPMSGGQWPAVMADANGKELSFLLGAVRIGDVTFRLMYAVRGAGQQERAAFEASLLSIRHLSDDEVRSVVPLRIRIIPAGPEDTQISLAAKIQGIDNRLQRFAIINGLRVGEQLTPGQQYKIIE